MNLNSVLNTLNWAASWLLPKQDADTTKLIVDAIEKSEPLVDKLEPQAEALYIALQPVIKLIVNNWPLIVKEWQTIQPAVTATLRTIEAHKKKGLTAPQAVQATVAHLEDHSQIGM